MNENIIEDYIAQPKNEDCDEIKKITNENDNIPSKTIIVDNNYKICAYTSFMVLAFLGLLITYFVGNYIIISNLIGTDNNSGIIPAEPEFYDKSKIEQLFFKILCTLFYAILAEPFVIVVLFLILATIILIMTSHIIIIEYFKKIKGVEYVNKFLKSSNYQNKYILIIILQLLCVLIYLSIMSFIFYVDYKLWFIDFYFGIDIQIKNFIHIIEVLSLFFFFLFPTIIGLFVILMIVVFIIIVFAVLFIGIPLIIIDVSYWSFKKEWLHIILCNHIISYIEIDEKDQIDEEI